MQKKRQKNITHGEKKIKTDSEETKTNELAHKNFNTVITVFHMFKRPEEGQNMYVETWKIILKNQNCRDENENV